MTFVRGFKTWCENTSSNLRRELDLRPQEPLDPQSLAEHLGVAVWSARDVPGVPEDALQVLLEEDPGGWSAVTIHVSNTTVVILNSAHSGGRPASNLMHELAHLIIGHEPSRIDVAEDGLLMLHTYSSSQEAEADWLGGCLLLPRPALLHIGEQGWTDVQAVPRYGVSKDMLRYRMNVTGVNQQMARRGRGNARLKPRKR